MGRKLMCIVCGTVTDQTRCLAHRGKQARGYGGEHEKSRKLAMALAPYCWNCGCHFTECKLEWHHVEPLYGGRSSETDNRRQLLCRKCHRDITNNS